MQKAPEGFREVQAEEATGVRLDREALKDGVIVQYRGTRRFAGSDRPTTVHIFLSRAGMKDAKRFSVFGSAQLDSKLENVEAGSILWMLYVGKVNVDGQPTHVWQLSNAGLRLDAQRLAEIRKNSGREDDALENAIARAEVEQQARKQQRGGSTMPSYGDYTDADAEAGAAR
jgi:hypothetical protein